MSASVDGNSGSDGARVLSGIRVVVTRAADQAAALSRPLAALGADVIELPATRVEPADPAPGLAALANRAAYGWLVITSQNGARMLSDLLARSGLDGTALAGLRVAAVGPATAAALEARGVVVTVTPRRFAASGLLDAMRGRDDVRGRRVLYLAAAGAREALADGLRALGAAVDVVPIYRSVPDVEGAAALRGRLLAGAIDVVTFTAGSAVRAFVDAVGADAAARAAIATIGPATSAAVRESGLAVRAEADPSTIDGLVGAVVAAVR